MVGNQRQPTGHWFSRHMPVMSLVTVGCEDRPRRMFFAISFRLLSPSNEAPCSIGSTFPLGGKESVEKCLFNVSIIPFPVLNLLQPLGSGRTDRRLVGGCSVPQYFITYVNWHYKFHPLPPILVRLNCSRDPAGNHYLLSKGCILHTIFQAEKCPILLHVPSIRSRTCEHSRKSE